jgi:peroxiredoxin
MAMVAAGKRAPTFELASTNGRTYRLREALERGPVLVAFFKVSCPTCQYAFPFLERLYQQFRHAGTEGATVWGIAQDPAAHAEEFARKLGVTFPVLIDDKPYRISGEYALTYVPSIFLISPDGYVQVASDGFSKRDLTKIHKLLADHWPINPPPLFSSGEQVPEFKPG